LERPGLPNLHKVSEGLYRSAQPTAEGMALLKEMGIRTVVNLRSFHSDRDEIGETGLAYEHIYMKTWHPEDEEVVRFLQIVTDPARQPVLVHCQHGADRTGTMCALYRVAVQGWSKEEAVAEMTEGPFGFHGIHANLVAYVRDLDVEAIKRRAGLAGEVAAHPDG
jgi:protein tyrosine/serine phosphatase